MKPLSAWTTTELDEERASLRRILADGYREAPYSMHVAFTAYVLVRPDSTSESQSFTIGALEKELRLRKKVSA